MKPHRFPLARGTADDTRFRTPRPTPLTHDSLLEDLRASCPRHKVDPDSIELEIHHLTEGPVAIVYWRAPHSGTLRGSFPIDFALLQHHHEGRTPLRQFLANWWTVQPRHTPRSVLPKRKNTRAHGKGHLKPSPRKFEKRRQRNDNHIPKETT